MSLGGLPSREKTCYDLERETLNTIRFWFGSRDNWRGLAGLLLLGGC